MSFPKNLDIEQRHRDADQLGSSLDHGRPIRPGVATRDTTNLTSKTRPAFASISFLLFSSPNAEQLNREYIEIWYDPLATPLLRNPRVKMRVKSSLSGQELRLFSEII
ncbi:hypothetical protein QE152_g5149 [Popillia japonica]|uniref:Ribosomal protein S10 n=1 Tax=Popillia japonica TaxID=7064 RepID=A0AAW1N0E6_POPJA